MRTLIRNGLLVLAWVVTLALLAWIIGPCVTQPWANP